MKKNKKRIIVISVIVVFIVSMFLFLMIYLNNSQNNYTFLEKKWIDNNSNTIIDVYIEKDLPIFSLTGSGVYYDLTEDLEKDTGLSFNYSYSNASPIVMDIRSTVKDNDIVIYKDHYVLLSKTNVYVNNINSLGKITVGVLSDELTNISYNLTNNTNIEYKTYNSIEDLDSALEKGNVNYIILCLYENLNTIIQKEYDVIYHFDGLNKYYTLSFSNPSKEIVSIIKKFVNKWEEKKKEDFNNHYVELFYSLNKYTEIEKESIINDDFLVGYIENLPFEGKINNTFTGLTGLYLSDFSKITGTTYKYIHYKNIEKLKKSINDKKVDIVYNAYGINNANYISTNYVGSKNIVVLIPNKSDLVVNSIYDLYNKEVTMLTNRSLKNTYSGKNIFKIIEKDSVESLLKEPGEIVLIEKEAYDYYKNDKLENYKIAYIDNEYVYDSFMLNNSNEALNKLFSFYISTVSSKEIVTRSISQTLTDKTNNMFLTFIVDNVFYLIIGLSIIGYVLYRYGNKIRLSKKIKKEDKLLYLDVMTNLKNRNYLNDNIEYWEKNIIFPQTIIILDLDNIKELNDKNGHEAGDNQIRVCANILIKTQRENSEIMRTDGNEFTIYLVGYEEKMIMSYIHKLNKELKSNLPFKDYGVSIGYSMITDEIKTIDDAINESLIMVKDNKGKENGKN